MYEELQLALWDIISPEQLYVILEAQRLLNDIGLTTADDELQNVIGLQDGISDNTILINRIEDVLLYAVGSALNEYGITLRDDAPFPLMVGILRTVSQFELYLIPESLSDVINSADDNEEVVSYLVPLFTEFDEQEALDNIVTVEDATIRRMHAVVEELIAVTPTDNPVVEKRELRIKRINQMLIQTQRMHPLIVVDLAQSGVRMGQPLDLLVTQVIDRLEPLALEPLAYEMLGLTYYSNTPISDILQATLQGVEELIDEIKEQVTLRELIHQKYHEFSDLDEVNS